MAPFVIARMECLVYSNLVVGEIVARTKIVGSGSKKKYRSRSTSASSQDSFSSGSYSGMENTIETDNFDIYIKNKS